MKKQVFVLVILTACTSSLAVAADKEDAKRLFESGLKLMKVDDFSSAAANFERSAALYPTQTALFNLANCYKALQRYAEALEVVGQLHRDFGAKLKPEIKEAVEQQEAEIRSVVATLVVKVVPGGARVVIDGREVGAAPSVGPLFFAPGDHIIEAIRAGYRPVRRSVRLVSGAEQTEQLQLEPEPGHLVVRGEPSGASVLVDGVERATTPLSEALELSPGIHVVALRAAGHRQAERRVEVQAGERQVLEIALAPLDATAPAVSMAEKGGSPGASFDDSLANHGGENRPGRPWKVLAWSTSAGAALAGGTALVFWKVFGDQRLAAFQSYDAQYANTGSEQSKANRDAAAADTLRDGKIAVGCGIAAGALAVTALVAFLVDPSAEPADAAPRNTVSLSPRGLQVVF